MSFVKTLILNQRYQPHNIEDWRDCVTLMFKGRVEVLAQYDEVLAVVSVKDFPELRAALRQVCPTDVTKIELKVPAVAMLRRKTPTIKQGVKFNKENICIRDKFTCAYCRKTLPFKDLNKDHVVPRTKGGKTNWTNIVMTCYGCNNRKGGKTPEEAGMRLWAVPTIPQSLPMTGPNLDGIVIPKEWKPFLPEMDDASSMNTVH